MIKLLINILEQSLTNLIVCLMISQKLHTNVAQTSYHVAVDTKQVCFFTKLVTGNFGLRAQRA